MEKDVQFQEPGPCCNQNLDILDHIDRKFKQGCGCSLRLKLRSLSSECPAHKWLALTTEQEEEMINKQIESKPE